MKRELWFAGALLATAALVSVPSLAAQGVTTAAVAGRITDEAGAPVALAELTLVSGSTGERHSAQVVVIERSRGPGNRD